MAQQVRCDGCGEFENVGKKDNTIERVTLNVIFDSRSWVENPEYSADLCLNCRKLVLHNYFGVASDDILMLPRFIEGTERQHSLRVAR